MKITWFDAGGTEHVLNDPVIVPPVNSLCEMQVTRVTGVGMPDVRDITEQGPYQHGESWLYGLLEGRQFRLDIRVNNKGSSSNVDTLVRAISEICRWFNPQPNPDYGLGRMRFETEGVRREAVCRYVGGLKVDVTDSDVKDLADFVELRMPDPLFYDPTESVAAFLYTVDENLILPFTFPFILGFSGINDTQNITNSGDWEVYPIIEIIGPADSVTIENKTTNQILELEYAIAVGETVTIDLSYDVKTVENNFGDDLKSYLTPESDLEFWKLATQPEATGGINSVYVSAPNATTDTEITFRWNNKYLSI